MISNVPLPIITLQQVTRRFGGLTAVSEVDVEIAPRTIHGLIGPNGAGKSTTFDMISGLTRVSSGRILMDGNDITASAVEARVALGVCRTFQTSQLFEEMSVLETVMTGFHRHASKGARFWRRGAAKSESEVRHAAFKLISQMGLEADQETIVSNLSYGRRRLVEIARALATGPRVLLLDEVASGLNPVETENIARLIRNLAASGMTVVVVEHDMPFVMGLCERVTVLNFGCKIADGTPEEIRSNPAVIEAYLGRPREGALSRREARRQAMAAKVTKH